MISRRTLLGSLAAGSTAWGQPRPGGQPNLLVIVSDDHTGHVLGAHGNALAETPHLDGLAAEGTRFTRHYCNSPVCTPSRQSFLTGLLPHAAGVTTLRTPLADGRPTLARQLRAAGYTTAALGKMHFNRPGQAGLHGFDYLLTEPEWQKAWNAEPASKTPPETVRTKPPWRPFKDPARIWLNAEKLPSARFYEEMKGTFLARQACRFLEENRQRPFALVVSFQEPHSPFDFPVDDQNVYDPARFPVPRVGPEDAGQIPLIFRDLSDADKQGIAAAYYTSVRFMDRNAGVVLDCLKKLNLGDNTLVVYTSDNGYMLGEHGRFEKHCGYDPALHVPLIVRWPGRVRAGTVTDMTEMTDLTATLLDMLGAEPLPQMHGQSLRPYLEGKRPASPRGHVFSEYLENEEAYIRTEQYKFVFCSGKRERTDGYRTDHPTPGRYVRLFDLKRDPGEFTNIAARQPTAVRNLAGLMLKRFRQTHPEAAQEPARLSREEAIEWYLRPRDAAPA